MFHSMFLCFLLIPKAHGTGLSIPTTRAAIADSSPAPMDAQPATPVSDSPPSTAHAGWVLLNASLILYDASGSVIQEVGLGSWDEDADGGLRRRHIIRGAASRNGRFAWSWEKILTFPPGHEETQTIQSKLLHFWGSDGQELWHDEWANVPEGMDPAILSPSGEHILIVEGEKNSGGAVLYDYLGNRLLETLGTGPAEFFTISPKGKFALVRWHQMDQPPTYTMMDNHNRIARTIPSNKIMQGDIKIDDDGKIFVGGTFVFDIAASSAAARPPAAAPSNPSAAALPNPPASPPPKLPGTP